MKTRINHLIFVLMMAVSVMAQESGNPPGIVVNHISKETGRYIGSPSLCVLPDGTYIASHDEFGPRSSEYRSAQTLVFQSKDKGLTWKKITQIDGQFWSNLFFHNGNLYLMGTNKHHGNLIIRKSEDGGHTWTIPCLKTNGLILEGEYHTAPMPMIYHNGRIWRAVEYATAPTSEWGKRYSAMVLSAPMDADLLNADNWQKTNWLPFDPAYLNGNFRAWLEGNVVVDPDGNMVDILRVDIPVGMEEQAAVARISQDGKTASFDPEKDFIPLPGGSKKFTIRYDDKSKRYWMLANYISSEYKERHPAGVRNKQALCSSADLRKWTIHQIVLDHPDVEKHGFQYVDWLFDGDDIVFLSRTAYDDKQGGANNNHDANFLTFHRIDNFREKKILALDNIKSK
ncbi:sialidase family protein [Proteiniphilum sp.]|uniref:sialidase family protein n=1 Tax=Proteiniphilum sp. TaxID=1926877 RepID=UPI002B22117F|nr:sialidase family protein [Proteiniphilum sp.]MEA4916180.1 sialidase family protein [Proteiniphilum sp.]